MDTKQRVACLLVLLVIFATTCKAARFSDSSDEDSVFDTRRALDLLLKRGFQKRTCGTANVGCSSSNPCCSDYTCLPSPYHFPTRNVLKSGRDADANTSPFICIDTRQ